MVKNIMMIELIGLPGSGKSTYSKKYIEEYNSTHDTPLLRDAGTLLGQPIEARKY